MADGPARRAASVTRRAVYRAHVQRDKTHGQDRRSNVDRSKYCQLCSRDNNVVYLSECRDKLQACHADRRSEAKFAKFRLWDQVLSGSRLPLFLSMLQFSRHSKNYPCAAKQTDLSSRVDTIPVCEPNGQGQTRGVANIASSVYNWSTTRPRQDHDGANAVSRHDTTRQSCMSSHLPSARCLVQPHHNCN